jgi:hypothetical protein
MAVVAHRQRHKAPGTMLGQLLPVTLYPSCTDCLAGCQGAVLPAPGPGCAWRCETREHAGGQGARHGSWHTWGPWLIHCTEGWTAQGVMQVRGMDGIHTDAGRVPSPQQAATCLTVAVILLKHPYPDQPCQLCPVLFIACSQTTTNATGSYACESSDVHAYGMNIGRTVFGHTMGLFTCLKGAQWCSHPRWLPSVVDRAQGADAGEQGLCGPGALLRVGAVCGFQWIAHRKQWQHHNEYVMRTQACSHSNQP